MAAIAEQIEDSNVQHVGRIGEGGAEQNCPRASLGRGRCRKLCPSPILSVTADVGEELLAAAYLLLSHDRLLDVVFYDRKPSIREFLGWLALPNSRYLAGFVGEGASSELAGLGWLWNCTGPDGGRRADVGIVYLKKFWGSEITDALTSKMLDVTFGPLKVDIIYATTMWSNRLSRGIAKRMGFEMFGPLPKYGMVHGKPGDAAIGYLTRERWQEVSSDLQGL